MTSKNYTIGILSKRAGVKVTTIRYYESIGLMPSPARSENGQRLYEESAIEQLSFIRHARELGFPMDMIRELIELQSKKNKKCSIVDELAQRHLKVVQDRLSQLQALEKELIVMTNNCKGGSIGACNVMSCLLDHENCYADSHGKIDITLK